MPLHGISRAYILDRLRRAEGLSHLADAVEAGRITAHLRGPSLARLALSELVVAAQYARFLLVVSYRPEYRDEWRNRPNYRQIRPRSLSEREPYGIPSGPGGPRPESCPSKELPGEAGERESVLRRGDCA